MVRGEDLGVRAPGWTWRLPRQFLGQPIRNIEVGAAKDQSELKEIVGRRVVVERRQVGCGTPNVMKILNRGRIKIAVRGRARERRKPSEGFDMAAEASARISSDEVADVAGDLARNRHIQAGLGVDADHGSEGNAKLSGNAAGQHLYVVRGARVDRSREYRRLVFIYRDAIYDRLDARLGAA